MNFGESRPAPERLPIPAAITGQEPGHDRRDPHSALVHFYRAFNGRDADAMRANWSSSDEVAMSNPLGGVKRGWREIAQVYERLFAGSARVYVEFYDYTLHEATDMFYAVGRERGYFEQSGERLMLAIRTSRVFRRIEGVWCQVHHHGSIDDPELLARYQRAVKGS